ncbi:MAG: ion transporter [Prevotella sp.]|nr:ion transporter [Prevotella sp.]
MNIRQQLEIVSYLIEPHNETQRSLIYDRIMLVAIILGILPLMFRGHHTLFSILDIASCTCFIIDYLLRWATYAVQHPERRALKSYVIYPFTPMAIIDMLSILPTFSLLTPALKIARVSRLLKLLRVIKFVRYFEPLEIILSVIRRQRHILYTVFSLALLYTFITAMIMFNAEEEINPNTGEYLFRNFFDAFYWAVCTLTTVGYGDLYPISTIGRIISIISSMVGIAIVALPSGIITAGYLDELKDRKGEGMTDQETDPKE